MTTRTISLILLLMLLPSTRGFAAENASWLKQSSGILETKVNCLYISPSDSFILAGTSKALYRSNPLEGVFVPVLELQGNAKSINQIYTNPKRHTTIYAATDAGLFVSLNQGNTWYSIYSPGNVLQRKCLSILTTENEILIGTANGLLSRRSGEQDWKKESGELGEKTINHLQEDTKYIYAATDSDIYRILKTDMTKKKIYSFVAKESDAQESIFENGEPLNEARVRDLAISPNGKKLYLVTPETILVSADHGETWNAVNIIGLPINSVNKLSVKSDKVGTDELYAATEKGVFIYTKGQWHADVQGLATNQIKDLAESTAGILYAATGEGVFVKASETAVRKHKAFPAKLNTHEFDQIFALEPTIADVHHMAVDYANVNPNQIKNWHKESRAKAFLPTLSVGLNRSATELLHWDSGSNPDTLLRGRDYLDWSTSLSWNFSDFVWSSDHTTIDSRSKLMSELRTDILDQITRLYFERRRIQVELATRMDLDEAAYLEKQMRLEELTALIDGFTGGEFSRNIRQNDLAKNP